MTPAIKKTLDGLVINMQQLKENADGLAQSLFPDIEQVKLDDMSEDVGELKKLFKQCESNLRDIHRLSYATIKNLHKCLKKGALSERKQRKIKRDINTGNFTSLHAYLTKLSKLLHRNKLAYDRLEKACKLSRSVCEEGISYCEKRKKEANDKKIEAERVGKVITSASIVCAIVAGIATVSTGGAAFPAICIGSVITAAMSELLSRHFANKYEETAAIFRKIEARFSSIQVTVSDIDTKMQELLKSVQYDVDMVQEHDEDADSDSVCNLFDTLMHTMDEAQEKVNQMQTGKKWIG